MMVLTSSLTYLVIVISNILGLRSQEIIVQPNRVTVCIGENATFICEVNYKNRENTTLGWQILNMDGDFVSVIGRDRHSLNTTISAGGDILIESLTIADVTISDNGSLYRCNPVEFVLTSATASLTVAGPPGSIPDLTIPPDMITSTSFVAQWSEPYSNPVCGPVQYIVTVSTGGRVISNVTIDETTYTATGLCGNTNYTSIATAFNDGASGPSTSMVATTGKPDPLGRVRNLTIPPENITSTSFVVQWSEPFSDSPICTFQYIVTISAGVMIFSNVTITSTIYTATGLCENVKYRVNVTHIGEGGNGLTATSEGITSEAAIVDLKIENITQSSATFVCILGCSSTGLQCMLRTSFGRSVVNDITVPDDPGYNYPTQLITLTNLRSGTTYNYCVIAVNVIDMMEVGDVICGTITTFHIVSPRSSSETSVSVGALVGVTLALVIITIITIIIIINMFLYRYKERTRHSYICSPSNPDSKSYGSTDNDSTLTPPNTDQMPHKGIQHQLPSKPNPTTDSPHTPKVKQISAESVHVSKENLVEDVPVFSGDVITRTQKFTTASSYQYDANKDENIFVDSIDYENASKPNVQIGKPSKENFQEMFYSAPDSELCPFPDENVVSKKFNQYGGTLKIERHAVLIHIPENAIAKSHLVEMKACGSLVGPYQLPEGYECVSIFIWVSCDYPFQKNVQMFLQHFEAVESEDDIKDLCLLTSSDRDKKFDAETDEYLYSMHEDEIEHYFKAGCDECYILTKTWCTKCIAKKKKAKSGRCFGYGYLERPIFSGGTVKFSFEMCFCYALKYCIETTKSQHDTGNFIPIKGSPIFFDLQKDSSILLKYSSQQSNLKISHNGDKMISQNEIDFQCYDCKVLKSLEEDNAYPPRFGCTFLKHDFTQHFQASISIIVQGKSPRRFQKCSNNKEFEFDISTIDYDDFRTALSVSPSVLSDTTENFTAYEYEGKGAIVARQDDALPSSSKAHYVHMDSFQKQKTPCADFPKWKAKLNKNWGAICDRINGPIVDTIAGKLKECLDHRTYLEVIDASFTKKIKILLSAIYSNDDDELFKKFCDILIEMKHGSLANSLIYSYEETMV